MDESIRWTTPVKHFMRSATEDTELGGRTIAQGDWLMLAYASGNRDGAVLAEPMRFKVDRSPTAIWRSATAPICAWASTWPRWRCASSGRSCCLACRTSNWRASRAAPRRCSSTGPKALPIRYTLG